MYECNVPDQITAGVNSISINLPSSFLEDDSKYDSQNAISAAAHRADMIREIT